MIEIWDERERGGTAKRGGQEVEGMNGPEDEQAPLSCHCVPKHQLNKGASHLLPLLLAMPSALSLQAKDRYF